MKKLLNWLWGLPQNLIGFVLYCVCKAKGRQSFEYKNANVTIYSLECGVSLGNYIFIPTWAALDEKERKSYINHEYGHTLQSEKLGIFYIIVILIPSMIWNKCFRSYRQKHNIDYYSFYTESWANKLGGNTL